MDMFSKIDKQPIFILGNPKSGTTAIAKLLALATEKSITADIIRAIPHTTLQLELSFGLISFEDFVNLYKHEFSKEIIKETFLIFYFDELKKLFKQAKYVFIVRHPYQNIRSILNRLKIPGNLNKVVFDEWKELVKTPVWRLALQSEMFGYKSKNYVDAMAFRWNFAVEIYKKHKDNFILVKYEDFVKSKKNYIENLANKLNLKIVNDISKMVDIQFQPKGDTNVDIYKFFGTNIKYIINHCRKNMALFDYEV